MKYRSEIDGLRAVAVLPVILFHSSFSVFSGGYIGVDVFFVISGYLITSILISELEEEQFSITRFYERRARRILPALFTVMFACLPFAYMWMLPSQLKDFTQSLVAVLFFASNILFWRESGYFATDTELMPLLHTWSLAVEEQYYLVFPIFLLLVWRFGRNKVFWSIVIIAAFSLFLSEWGWRNHPSANFYLVPTRAWELLAGSICAFLTVGRTLKSNNVLSGVGLATIVFSIFSFDENTPFPSVYALVPVVGTTLIILFGRQGTWVAKLLSMRAFVGIGMISYSAYLWHQPLFAFARLRSLTEPSHMLMTGLAVAALLLAWATWRWVEQPFRKRANPVLATRRSVFTASGIVCAAFMAVSLGGYLFDGHSYRLSEEQQTFLATMDSHTLRENCKGNRPGSLCLLQDVNSTPTYNALVIGDSHSSSILPALSQVAHEKGWNLYHSGLGGCPPLLNVYILEGNHEVGRCYDLALEQYEFARSNPVDIVFLVARWSLYVDRPSYLERKNRYFLCEEVHCISSIEKSRSVFEEKFKNTVNQWKSIVPRIIILTQIPQQIFSPIDDSGPIVMGGYYKSPSALAQFGVSRLNHDSLQAYVNSKINVVDRLGVEIVNLDNYLCTEKFCPVFFEGGSLYRDDDHLSEYGARAIFEELQNALE